MQSAVDLTEDLRFRKYIRRGLIAWTVTHAIVVTMFLFLNMRVVQTVQMMVSLMVATIIEYGAAVMLLAAADMSNLKLLNICYLYYVMKATAYAGLLAMCEMLKPIWRPDLMEFRSVDPLRFYLLLDNRGLALVDLLSQIYLTLLVRMQVQALGGKPLFRLAWFWRAPDSDNEATPEDQMTTQDESMNPSSEEDQSTSEEETEPPTPGEPTSHISAEPTPEPTVPEEPRPRSLRGLCFLSVLHIFAIVAVFVIVLNDITFDIIDYITRRDVMHNDTSDMMIFQ